LIDKETDMILSYVILTIAMALTVWGSQTRGTWSQNIAIIGGWCWLITLIVMFFLFGIKDCLIATFISFVIGAIFTRIFPRKI